MACLKLDPKEMKFLKKLLTQTHASNSEHYNGISEYGELSPAEERRWANDFARLDKIISRIPCARKKR